MTPTRTTTAAMTLVEVLAVVIILGLIAATLTVTVGSQMGEAKRHLTITAIGSLKSQLDVYKMKKGSYPSAAEGLEALSQDPSSPWYVEPGKLRDPWGTDYVYVVPGPGRHPFEIFSYGADGREGGEGEDADVSSVDLGASH